MKKLTLTLAAVFALAVSAAQAQTVCVAEDTGTEEDPTCTVTCCNDVLVIDPANPPMEPPTPVPPDDPSTAICGSVGIDGVAMVSGFLNPNGEPPSGPEDTGSIIEGCISLLDQASTADAVGTGSCNEQAVAACVQGDCASSNTTDGPCPEEEDDGGSPLPIPGDLPAPPEDLPIPAPPV